MSTKLNRALWTTRSDATFTQSQTMWDGALFGKVRSLIAARDLPSAMRYAQGIWHKDQREAALAMVKAQGPVRAKLNHDFQVGDMVCENQMRHRHGRVTRITPTGKYLYIRTSTGEEVRYTRRQYHSERIYVRAGHGTYNSSRLIPID